MDTSDAARRDTSGRRRRPPRLVIVATGSTVAPLIPVRGDFPDWFREGLGLEPAATAVCRPHRGEPLPDPQAVPAVVVTGSPSMVTDEAPWSLACERWLRSVVARGVPVLAVCYGHQLLARAFGGEVGPVPGGREIGTIDVRRTAAGARSPLLAGLGEPLRVQTTHQQSVTRLPVDAVHLATGARDPHQAFAIGDRAFGVQFHPEFDAGIMRGYFAARADDLRADGIDPQAGAAACADSDDGRRLLRNFRALADAAG